jgi:hypothetical protein
MSRQYLAYEEDQKHAHLLSYSRSARTPRHPSSALRAPATCVNDASVGGHERAAILAR